MSILRSFMYREFPFINEYDELEPQITNSLHIATGGMLGRHLLHIAIGVSENNGDPKRFDYETEVNLSVEEAKIVLKHIEAFISHNEGKPWSEDLAGYGIRFE
jgi:hypothetical protein